MDEVGIISKQLKHVKEIQLDHPNETRIHLKRLNRVKKELEPLMDTSFSGPAGKKSKRYLEKYEEEMNNDEYILSSYALYIGAELSIIAYSKCLYSTGSNLGSKIPMSETILDIGCGVGRTALDYSKFLTDGIMIAMDLEYSKVRLAYDILKTKSIIKFIFISNFNFTRYLILNLLIDPIYIPYGF